MVEEGRDRVSAISLRSGRVTPVVTSLDLGPPFPPSQFAAPHGTLNGVAVAHDGTLYVSKDGDDNAVFQLKRRSPGKWWHRR